MRINRLTTRLRTLRPAAAALVASALLAGCSAVNDPENPCPDPEPGQPEENSLALSFRVTTSIPLSRKAPSRADSENHPEETYDYAFEDEINLNDFGFFIFAYKADGSTDPVLLYKNTNVTASSSEMEIAGGLGDYTVNLDLPASLAEQFLTDPTTDLSPNGSRSLKVRIAIIANSNASRQKPGLAGFNDLKAAWDDKTTNGVATFTQFTDIAKDMVFTPDYTGENLLIPMYGLSEEFTMGERDMYFSRPDDRMMLGEVSLLRAMNKVRLVNAIPADEMEGEYPQLVSATITYGSPDGFVTPAAPGNYVNGQQVHTDRVLSAAQTRPTQAFMEGTLVDKSLITYLPVQTLQTGAPTLMITMRNAAGETREFPVDLADPQYETIHGQWGEMMLRNHVYTLAITSVRFGVELQLTATVADWDDAPEFNLDYTETVNTATGGEIDWYNGTSYSETITDGVGQLIVLPWKAGVPVPARCSFALANPDGAIWTASLITLEGDPAAFKFRNEAKELVDQIQGRIDKTQTDKNTLSIVPVIEHPTVNSRARLQIMVSLSGGERFVDATTPDILGQWDIVQTQE